MHRKVGFVLAAIAVLGMLSLPQPDLSPALKQIQLNYQSHLTGFAQSLSAYRVALEKGDEATIRQNHQNCRLAFKRAEYLLTHFDKSAVKAFLNGAPLPRIQQTGRQQIQVFEPEGLQILDEMVMESPLPQEQMLAKVKLIEEQFASLAAFEKQRSLEASRVMEAMQSQLVRIMALGITGFDTPGTLYGLPEAQASLLTMWEDFQEFEPHLHPKARSEFVRATALFQLAIADLKQTFADFDRMAFVRDRINPLYEAFAQVSAGHGDRPFSGKASKRP
jgi:cytochrome c peroxidase